MGLIRIVHQKHYDPRQGRFKSLAFKNYGEGISVIDEDCIRRLGNSVCDHIRGYYPGVYGEPPVFWRVRDDAYRGRTVTQSDSFSGDRCHHDIVGLTDKEARRVFKTVPIEEFQICDPNADNGTRSLTTADLGA